MLKYIVKRLLMLIPILFVISLISFVVIQLPPGDYLTTMVINLEAQNVDIPQAQVELLRERFGYGDPVIVQYFKWIGNFITGNMGYSLIHDMPVSELIGERIGLTIGISLTSMILTWAIALPIGVYSATHKYKLGDYTFTTMGFIGMAIPDFFLALLLMYFCFTTFGWSIGGLFSPEMVNAPWSIAKFIDFLQHVWIPVFVLGISGTAGTMRVMRSSMIDELKAPYVKAARGRGLKEKVLIWRYPVKASLNPFLSTIGWMLPTLISGSEIIAIVLNLPTTGPLLLEALQAQDMYLAAGILMILSILAVIGTLISDVILAYVDPRIRLENK